MNRGVVIEIGKRHVVVMTPDGGFRKVPGKPSAAVGEEIRFAETARLRRPARLRAATVGSAALVLLLLLPFMFNNYVFGNPVAAYLTMDINPSIELGVDKDNLVKDLRSLNPDGEAVTEGLDYKGHPVDEVATAIMERVEQGPYLRGGEGDIVLTTVLVSGKAKPDYEEELTEQVGAAVRKTIADKEAARPDEEGVQITTLSAPKEVREEADKEGISAGKMAVYLMLKDKGYDISIEQLRKQSIHRIIESLGGMSVIVGADHADSGQDAAAAKEKRQEALAKQKQKLQQLLEKEKEKRAKADETKGDSSGSDGSEADLAGKDAKNGENGKEPKDNNGSRPDRNGPRGHDAKDGHGGPKADSKNGGGKDAQSSLQKGRDDDAPSPFAQGQPQPKQPHGGKSDSKDDRGAVGGGSPQSKGGDDKEDSRGKSGDKPAQHNNGRTGNASDRSEQDGAGRAAGAEMPRLKPSPGKNGNAGQGGGSVKLADLPGQNGSGGNQSGDNRDRNRVDGAAERQDGKKTDKQGNGSQSTESGNDKADKRSANKSDGKSGSSRDK